MNISGHTAGEETNLGNLIAKQKESIPFWTMRKEILESMQTASELYKKEQMLLSFNQLAAFPLLNLALFDILIVSNGGGRLPNSYYIMI